VLVVAEIDDGGVEGGEVEVVAEEDVVVEAEVLEVVLFD
jgi:hypothetical protein